MKLRQSNVYAVAELLADVGITSAGACNLTPRNWSRLGTIMDVLIKQCDEGAVLEALVEIEQHREAATANVRAMKAGAGV